MQLFRHKEDRIPVLIFFLYFVLDIIVFLSVQNKWIAVAWFLVGIIPKGWISAWNHHHQHVNMFRPVWANRLLEIMFGFQTGITSHGWTLHHVVGHHVNYLDQSKDESRWKTLDGRPMGMLEYTWMTTVTAYYRSYQVSAKYPKYRRTYVTMGLLQIALLAGLFWLNPWNALFVFALPMIASLTVTVWATYDHHAGNETTTNHFEASNNIMDKWYNLVTGNLGYHTAHHYRQAVHWSKLPALHHEISPKIPAKYYYKPGVPLSFLDKDPKGAPPTIDVNYVPPAQPPIEIQEQNAA